MSPEESQILDEQVALRMAALFASLSDPTRLRIIRLLLSGEVNVGETALKSGLSRSAVSHQLRSLRDKRVIRTRKQGKQVFVALDDSHIAELFQKGFDHVQHE